MPGVIATAVGYSGGHTEHPTYRSVCNGTTGHAEVVLVEFDPSQVSYSDLLERFFDMHHPSWSEGSQYRSEIFAFGEEQRSQAEQVIEARKVKGETISTHVSDAGTFWLAEDYHQQYYEKRGLAIRACATS